MGIDLRQSQAQRGAGTSWAWVCRITEVLLWCGSNVSGSDEDCEPAELHCSSQSRDAARSPEAFWQGFVCLSGSQGNYH